MKDFIIEKHSAFKAAVRTLVTKMDSVVEPSIGKTMHRIFKTMSLVLMIVGIPVLAMSLYGAVLASGSVSFVAIVMYPAMSLLIVSLLGWFWFSKWNV